MKYYLYDDCTSSKSAVYDKVLAAENMEDAIKEAYSEWKVLTDDDKRNRDAFYIGELWLTDEECEELVESGESILDHVHNIIDFKTEYRIKPEFYDYWGDESDKHVSFDEIVRLAHEWECTVSELLEQVEEI